MKHFVNLILLFLTVAAFSQRKKVPLEIFITSEYCGGARPDEKMKAEIEKPVPYTGTIIYISEKGKVDSAKTNEAGKVTLKLRKGKYLVQEPWRYYLYTPHDLPIESFDRDCIKKEWEKLLMTIRVEKKGVIIHPEFPLHRSCPWNAPCILQSEPPPVAPRVPD
jgi:hypothetical protein